MKKISTISIIFFCLGSLYGQKTELTDSRKDLILSSLHTYHFDRYQNERKNIAKLYFSLNAIPELKASTKAIAEIQGSYLDMIELVNPSSTDLFGKSYNEYIKEKVFVFLGSESETTNKNDIDRANNVIEQIVEDENAQKVIQNVKQKIESSKTGKSILSFIGDVVSIAPVGNFLKRIGSGIAGLFKSGDSGDAKKLKPYKTKEQINKFLDELKPYVEFYDKSLVATYEAINEIAEINKTYSRELSIYNNKYLTFLNNLERATGIKGLANSLPGLDDIPDALEKKYPFEDNFALYITGNSHPELKKLNEDANILANFKSVLAKYNTEALRVQTKFAEKINTIKENIIKDPKVTDDIKSPLKEKLTNKLAAATDDIASSTFNSILGNQTEERNSLSFTQIFEKDITKNQISITQEYQSLIRESNEGINFNKTVLPYSKIYNLLDTVLKQDLILTEIKILEKKDDKM